jgi:hypothetical protein
MKHTCPACGKAWECKCEPVVIREHCVDVGGHYEEIACSVTCAEHLSALMAFLRRYGL